MGEVHLSQQAGIDQVVVRLQGPLDLEVRIDRVVAALEGNPAAGEVLPEDSPAADTEHHDLQAEELACSVEASVLRAP